ncbi:hypothetical protein SDC9_171484 [bioreactor metagenome]|uniref:Uncharacterized protein n=1 Tax=bioreactor metagenome TaxID=1076179 RepID=A0A645GDD7_9ZZZZ
MKGRGSNAQIVSFGFIVENIMTMVVIEITIASVVMMTPGPKDIRMAWISLVA